MTDTKIPEMMNAVRLHTADGPAGLVYEQVETPKPKNDEVLVRVHAAAITRDELDWPVDRLPAIPSYEFSGDVVGLGSKVEDVTIGEDVYALGGFDRNGAAADYIVVQKEYLAPKPKTLSHVQSASIPLAALSAWQGLFDHGKLTAGQRVLIHGAAGGVGHFAAQLACQRGAYVIGTVSSGNITTAQKLGVTEVIDYTATRFEDVIDDVDLVFDTAGGQRLERSPSVIRKGDRLISVASKPPKEQAEKLGIKSLYFVVSPNREQLVEIGKLFDRGLIHPTISAEFPLADARGAFERSLLPSGVGKIVLRITEE
jgi:NADPH:quinone reductase-like Zn-dependent oxidoreductase